ncbi:hypothetical protein BDA99DRAFT_543523 [Phascolomyces articulosus]|uniref:Uncharacterized protein n=1 Tax=Phascolomyces articulosus TaxID=60185 RepID=A0AAD5JMC1_9FUNG|nr:hypothetical protein BDA99DRAFT_543523 [Phascolomyces articulosus]
MYQISSEFVVARDKEQRIKEIVSNSSDKGNELTKNVLLILTNKESFNRFDPIVSSPSFSSFSSLSILGVDEADVNGTGVDVTDPGGTALIEVIVGGVTVADIEYQDHQPLEKDLQNTIIFIPIMVYFTLINSFVPDRPKSSMINSCKFLQKPGDMAVR